MLPNRKRALWVKGSLGPLKAENPEVCGNQHFESLLCRGCLGKVKLKTKAPASWVSLKLRKFPGNILGFSLSPKHILARAQQALHNPGDYPPPGASGTAQLGGTLPHRTHCASRRGNPCSSRCQPTARLQRDGWRGWGARRKGSGSLVQEFSLAANLVGRLLGQRCLTPADAWAGQGSASVPWTHSPHVFSLTLCGGLTLAGHWVPPSCSITSLLSMTAGRGGENEMEKQPHGSR